MTKTDKQKNLKLRLDRLRELQFDIDDIIKRLGSYDFIEEYDYLVLKQILTKLECSLAAEYVDLKYKNRKRP